MTLLEEIAGTMNDLHEARWDRCVRHGDGSGAAFGWIGRRDGRVDFVVLHWDKEAGVGFTTSSAELSRVFSERLFGDANSHQDCERVEDVFGDLVKSKVVLGRKPGRAA